MLIIVILLPVPATIAEYRAYELLIENPEKGTQRKVISTLDHMQYPKYYPLNGGETVSYVDSWKCYHNGSQFQDTCPAPSLGSREPAQQKTNSQAE